MHTYTHAYVYLARPPKMDQVSTNYTLYIHVMIEYIEFCTLYLGSVSCEMLLSKFFSDVEDSCCSHK